MSKEIAKRPDTVPAEHSEQVEPKVTWHAPAVDVYEGDNDMLLIADMPGVSADRLTISVDQEQLIVEGTRPEPQGTALHGHARPDRYRRTFVMPQGIDHDKVTAELKQGVLHLRLPKAEALKPRQITVKAV